MSAKIKVMLVAFISLVSIAAWSFAEEVHGQVVNAGKGVKSEAKVTKIKTAKVKKEKTHTKGKKIEKDATINK